MPEDTTAATSHDGVDEDVHVSLARTAALFDRAVAQVLRPYGLTPTQYNVLRILRGAGPAGLCRHELGDRLVTPVPDVTRLLDRMAELHLIARQRADADRRLVRTYLTSTGLDLVNRLDDTVRRSNRERLAHMPSARLRDAIDLLADLRARA